MVLKSKIFIGLLALCLAGSVAGVFALTKEAANKTGDTGAYDKAVYLFWDSGQDSVELADMGELTVNNPQYRYLTVAPKTSKGVVGNVVLTFTLASGGENTHMNGLSVKVYKTESLATDQTVETLINNVEATPSLDKDHLTGQAQFAVNARDDSNADAYETTAYFAIKVVWNGANDNEHQSYQLGATLNISQDFSETPAE